MNIIIIGCGKVGRNLAELLSSEQHNIVVIDINRSKVEQLTENLDIMGLVGNGASIDTLNEANVQAADILIAVTNSDETNLLMCLMAKKVGHCHTIARVRNPMYSREIDFIKAQMGISMIINPELAAATEISRLLHYPAAVEIDTFAKGRVQLCKICIQPGQALDGIKVKDLPKVCGNNVLLCAIERKDQVTIPGGDFCMQAGDMISVIASQDNMIAFFRNLGMPTNKVANTLIIGGGTIGFYLAKMLLESQIHVRIVDSNRTRCDDLSKLLPKASVICGDGTDRRLLEEEGLSLTESFVTLTNMDEENILLALYAGKHSHAKIITKVNHLAFDEIIDSMDIGSVIYPKYITADYILQYVRAQQNSVGNNIETLYRILDNRVEALEFSIHETSPVVDIPLMNLHLKPGQLICCIMRGDRVIIPHGSDRIQVGDSVVVVTLEEGLQDIRDILTK